MSAAELLVRCLENEDVRVVFGIPGEENIRITMALDRSSIRYVLARDERAAAFMAEMYARVTGEAGVVSATLGPGAINLQLGVADANTNSTPLVAISAQVGQHREYKESHQFVDLVNMFRPITHWSARVPNADAIPEMVRKAFKTAQTERPGAAYLAIPEDVDEAAADPRRTPLPRNIVRPEAPFPAQVARAAAVLRSARSPMVLAGHGAARAHAGPALARLAEAFDIPVATTFHGKGALADDHPCAVGTIGSMARDYVNFGFDDADLIITVGYELQEFDPARINPAGDKKIIHIHRFPAEVDAAYSIDVGIEGDLGASLDALVAEAADYQPVHRPRTPSAQLLDAELERGRDDERFPLAPQRIVADTRAALERDDVAWSIPEPSRCGWLGCTRPTRRTPA
jgi:acetolactate synthase-1/2/3 large subunit